ncbi:MAG: hypothetical protein HQL82_11720 [Magnetococcales bacterium]|nr:hypothetical protein [Magnetococcales bacterium]
MGLDRFNRLLFWILALRIALSYFGRATSAIGGYNFTHFQLNYGFGFIKRGLVGELLGWMFADQVLSAPRVGMLVYGFTAALLALLLVFLHRVMTRTGDPRVWTIALLLTFCPGTIEYIVLDRGRLDQVNYLVIAPALWGLIRGPMPLAALLAGLLGGVTVLIHEAALLIHVPLLAAVLYVRLAVAAQPWRRRGLAFLGLLLPVAGAVWLILVHGQPDVPPAELAAAIRERVGYVDPNVIGVYTDHQDLAGHYREFFRHRGDWSALVELAAAWLLLWGWCRIPLELFERFATLPLGPRERRLVMRAAFAPLLWMAMGIDWGRWTALAIFNCHLLLLILHLAWERPLPVERFLDGLRAAGRPRLRRLALAAGVALITIGYPFLRDTTLVPIASMKVWIPDFWLRFQALFL